MQGSRQLVAVSTGPGILEPVHVPSGGLRPLPIRMFEDGEHDASAHPGVRSPSTSRYDSRSGRWQSGHGKRRSGCIRSPLLPTRLLLHGVVHPEEPGHAPPGHVVEDPPVEEGEEDAEGRSDRLVSRQSEEGQEDAVVHEQAFRYAVVGCCPGGGSGRLASTYKVMMKRNR